MKILLIDDEPHVIKVIKKLVCWDELEIDTVLEANTARTALKLIEQEDPEIIITDIMMSDLTGLELMKLIAQDHPYTKVIIISGYSNFEYVREALRSGSLDYLLKPLDPASLNRAVRAAQESWFKEASKRTQERENQFKLRNMSERYVDFLLEKMLTSERSFDHYRELTQAQPELAQAVSGTLCTLMLNYCYSAGFFPDHIQCQRIRQSLRTLLIRSKSGYLFDSPLDSNTWIIFLWNNTSSVLREVERLIGEFNQKQDFYLHIGISDAFSLPDGFGSAYRQASFAFFQAPAAEKPPVLCFAGKMPPSSAATEDTPSEELLFSAVLSGNFSQLKQAVNLWFVKRQRKQLSIYDVLQLQNSFGRMVCGWEEKLKRKYPGFAIPVLEFPPYHKFSDDSGLFSPTVFVRYLFQYLQQFATAFSKAIPNEDRINQVAAYLEENYNKPFNQSECADRFYMSREYMCRAFSKKFGTTMVSYLNEIRINQAKKLLKDPLLTIRDIAYQVGFEDDKYFTRQFKKITGLTPSDYRITHL